MIETAVVYVVAFMWITFFYFVYNFLSLPWKILYYYLAVTGLYHLIVTQDALVAGFHLGLMVTPVSAGVVFGRLFGK